nr:hypothetical protein [Jatrophihabitans sp. GAS493]
MTAMRRRTVPGSCSGGATVAARLPARDWPDRRMFITAIDADTGEPVVFDRHSGVELVDAIAASCTTASDSRPTASGDRRYLDGGYRSNAENADLALGYGRVLVLSPFGGRSLHPPAWGTHLATQIEELRAHGSRVETIFPDPDAGAHVRCECDGSVAAPGRRPSRLRAGKSPGRTTRPVLALEVLIAADWLRLGGRRAENVEPRAGCTGANLARPMAGMSM